MRKFIRFSLFFLLFIFFVLPSFITAEEFQIKVIVDLANVYLKPDLNSSVIAKIPLNTILVVSEKKDGWFKTKLTPLTNELIVFGYIHYKTVSIVEDVVQVVKRENLEEISTEGRWRLFRGINKSQKKISDEQQKTLAKLAAYPYLQGSKLAPSKKDEIYYNEKLAYDGLNFFTSGHFPQAILMDMKGQVLHTWNKKFEEIWPEHLDSLIYEEHMSFWRNAYLFNNGDILAIFEGLGLIKLDINSNLIWSYYGGCHHDIFISKNGNIYTITNMGPILDDSITILSSNGEFIKSISLTECFLNSEYSSLYINMKKSTRKGFHTNSIVLFEDEKNHKIPFFKKGNLLLSSPTISTIFVVNVEKEKVVWTLSGMFKSQHDPTLLDNGNLLLFDNYADRGESRVIEIDLTKNTIIWEYRGNISDEFFTPTCGSNQRLPNGNILITESDNGRAFEITPNGEKVWEYISPFRSGKTNEFIATIFEMNRININFIDFLN